MDFIELVFGHLLVPISFFLGTVIGFCGGFGLVSGVVCFMGSMMLVLDREERTDDHVKFFFCLIGLFGVSSLITFVAGCMALLLPSFLSFTHLGALCGIVMLLFAGLKSDF